MDSKKSNKIREIVRLQQILKKWRKHANSSKSNNNATTIANTVTTTTTSGSKSMKFLKRTLSLSDREVVPKGCLAVCVGEEQKRFVIPTEYLSHASFQVLLREAEEEFGFQQAGVLRIPCEVGVFECILKMVEEKKESPFFVSECRFSVEDFVGYSSSSAESPLNQAHHPQSPMCR